MRTKYVHFTDAQRQAAKETDLASFLESRGEKIKRSGSEYEWVGHHITLRGNQFYDQYEQRGGTAVDFVQEQYGLSYPEAVQLLLGITDEFDRYTDIIRNDNDPLHWKYRVPDHLSHPEKKPFALPLANENMRRVYAYLIKQRCIDRDVIYHFAHRGLLYEDAQYHNAVFVGTDKDGHPRHAHKKSTSLNDSSFRANQTGSEAAFSFHHTGTSDTVYTFEAPIDMLSFISLYPKGWQKDSYATLCSVADHALFRLLEDNPMITQIVLCLDNDQAGRLACERIAAKLTGRGYHDVSVLLSQHKDWNEDLKQENGLSAIPAEIKETEDETVCQELQLS
jgi:hypothetical protein